MEATRIIAVRHGETAWNVDTRIQGYIDIPLNETGRWQAQRLAQALAGQEIHAVYSSDLSRAHATALAVAEIAGVPVTTDRALRERNFGSFEGRTFAEIETELPEQSLRWRKRDPEFAPEGGESLLQFRTRVTTAAHGFAARHPGQQILLVAHGGVLDVLYRDATGQELQAPRTWELGNAAINRLLWTPEGMTLVGWADTHHLQHEPTRDETSA
jgi:2,3-bisphosphoglycerate-dependent phosphoglycerate mutase